MKRVEGGLKNCFRIRLCIDVYDRCPHEAECLSKLTGCHADTLQAQASAAMHVTMNASYTLRSLSRGVNTSALIKIGI